MPAFLFTNPTNFPAEAYLAEAVKNMSSRGAIVVDCSATDATIFALEEAIQSGQLVFLFLFSPNNRSSPRRALTQQPCAERAMTKRLCFPQG